MTAKPLIFRQGDVMLRSIGAIPDGCVETPRDELGRVVLAHGEASGHAHAIRAKSVTSFKFATSEHHAMRGLSDFILVGGGSRVSLKHELVSGAKAEHDAFSLPPGGYEQLVPVEHTDEDEPRQVMD